MRIDSGLKARKLASGLSFQPSGRNPSQDHADLPNATSPQPTPASRGKSFVALGKSLSVVQKRPPGVRCSSAVRGAHVEAGIT